MAADNSSENQIYNEDPNLRNHLIRNFEYKAYGDFETDEWVPTTESVVAMTDHLDNRLSDMTFDLRAVPTLEMIQNEIEHIIVKFGGLSAEERPEA